MKPSPSGSDLTRRDVLGALALCMAAPAAWAQGTAAFPNKSVKIIVPSVPGGLMDVSARLVGNKLSSYWNVPVVVENKPGANMVIGAMAAIKSPPDGYTLFLGHEGSLVTNPLLQADNPYSAHDLIPLAQIWDTPLLLLVHAGLGPTTFAELDALVKKNPGKFNYPVNDIVGELHSDLLRRATGWDFQLISYKANPERSRSLMAGETQFGFLSAAEAAAVADTGRVKVLATTAPARAAQIPNVPTLDELGLKGFAITSWGGLFAPAGTPAAIVAKVSVDARRALAEREVLDKLAIHGTQVPYQVTGEQLTERIKVDSARWKRIADAKGMKTYER